MEMISFKRLTFGVYLADGANPMFLEIFERWFEPSVTSKDLLQDEVVRLFNENTTGTRAVGAVYFCSEPFRLSHADVRAYGWRVLSEPPADNEDDQVPVAPQPEPLAPLSPPVAPEPVAEAEKAHKPLAEPVVPPEPMSATEPKSEDAQEPTHSGEPAPETVDPALRNLPST
jgi:hypothetical protein